MDTIQITPTAPISLYYGTQQPVSFAVPTGTPATTVFKISIRERCDPSLSSMCDATGTVSEGTAAFTLDLLNATFLEVSQKATKAWLEVYADSTVFIQREVEIFCRAASLSGHPPAPITLYYTKAEVDNLLGAKVTLPAGGTAGQALVMTEGGTVGWGNTGGGSGTVKSVNDTLPDEQGNVTLTAGSVGALNLQGGTLSGNLDLQGLTASNVPDVTIVGSTFTPAVLGHYGYTVSQGDVIHIVPPANGKTFFDFDITVPGGTTSFSFDQFIDWYQGVPEFTPGSTTKLEIRYVGGTFRGSYPVDMDKYLSLSGGTMTGDLNFTNGVKHTINLGGGCNSGIRQASAISGYDCTYRAFCAVVGNACRAEYADSVLVAGSNLNNAYGQYNTVLGKYNYDTSSWSSVEGYFGHALVIGNGQNNSNRSNALELSWEGDLWLSGSINTSGQKIKALTSAEITAIPASEGIVYTYTLTGGEVITLASSKAGYTPTFELQLTQPSTAVSFTWGTTIWWDDGSGYFDPDNDAPDFSDGDIVYNVVLRYDGSTWLGNVAYTKKVVSA